MTAELKFLHNEIKKIIAVFVILCAVLVGASDVITASADSSQTDSLIDEQLSDFSTKVNEQLDEAIDSDTKQLMNETGTEKGNLSDFSLSDAIKLFWDKFTGALTEPLRILGRLAAVMILTALVQSVSDGAAAQSFSIVSLLGCITIIYRTVYESFSGVCEYLIRLNEFMLSYIPIYAAVTAAAGNFISGGSYYASAFAVCEIISIVAGRVIMPFLSVFLALSFTAAINPDMRFSQAAESIKNAVQVTLNALMTVFMGLTAIKGFSGAAADNAAARAVKFGASSFIPIIGGSVSEAYSSVYAGIGVIRAGVGTVGIAAAAFMLLQPIVTLICVKITLECARVIADLLGLGAPAELLRSTSYAMSAAISTTLCFSMMFILSTAVLMTISSPS